jgi:hypothetical protein
MSCPQFSNAELTEMISVLELIRLDALDDGDLAAASGVGLLKAHVIHLLEPHAVRAAD